MVHYSLAMYFLRKIGVNFNNLKLSNIRNIYKKRKVLDNRTNSSFKVNQRLNIRAHDAYLQVIGSGAIDQNPSLLLSTTNDRYLFNFGDGASRLFNRVGGQSGRIKNVFLTQSNWQCIGGVPALFLATFLSYGSVPRFHGPPKMNKIIQRILHLSTLGIQINFSTQDVDSKNNFFEDEAIRVDFIELTTNAQHDESTEPKNGVAFAYLCKLKKLRGAFAVEKTGI